MLTMDEMGIARVKHFGMSLIRMTYTRPESID
jgi:hypothetical protein